ncbi:MAG TPA: UDP-N-acetylmuramoyl-tripeptide--D-alanyl-D-alanine ligase [Streptosporangiaceae bacterium]
MIPMTLGHIASVTGGTLVGADPSATVTSEFVIDSRRVCPGSMFVAVVGERVDGHSFAAAAVAAGAAGVLGTRVVPGVPCVVVGSEVDALALLARSVLDALPSAVVAGITGSSGKTSTKDLCASLVERLGPTIAPAGSFNTEYGLPLTVLRADEATRYLVLEMSARGIGHIAYLCGIAPPRYGVVLNVGHAHAGEFGGLDQVAIAKGELVEALPSSGVAILNADDPRVAAMASRTNARVVTFGLGGVPPHGSLDGVPPHGVPPHGSNARLTSLERVNRAIDSATGLAGPDFRAVNVRLDELGRARFTLVTPEGSAAVALRVHGAHQVPNSLAAAALASALGLGLDDIADGLSGAVARSRWRMEVTTRLDGVVIINDAYNANPESVRAALDSLGHMARDGRAFAVLGHMAELGSSSAPSHAEVGAYAASKGLTQLIAVGDEAVPVLDGARSVSSWHGEAVAVPDGAAAVELLRDQLKPGDVVLVKASRAASLESAAAELLAEAGQ